MIIWAVAGALVAIAVVVVLVRFFAGQEYPLSSLLGDSDRIEISYDSTGANTTLKDRTVVVRFLGALHGLEGGWRENPFVRSQKTIWCRFYHDEAFRGGIGIGVDRLYYVPSEGASRSLSRSERKMLLQALGEPVETQSGAN